MHIEIIDASDMAVVTICPPGLRLKPIQDDGLIVSFRACFNFEAMLLRFLPIEIGDLARPLVRSRCSWEIVYEILNEGRWGSNWVAYQVRSPTQDLGHCHEMAAEIVSIVGKVYTTYAKPITAK